MVTSLDGSSLRVSTHNVADMAAMEEFCNEIDVLNDAFDYSSGDDIDVEASTVTRHPMAYAYEPIRSNRVAYDPE